MVGGPAGGKFGYSPKGWMMDYNYERWFTRMFCPLTKEEAGNKHRLLICDGHNSHINYEVAKAAYDNKVNFLCLPPNSTHALQPLDVSVFRSVKAMWSECCLRHYDKYPRVPIGKDRFQPMLKVIHEHCVDNPEHVVNGFKKCGFRPINATACHDKILGATERKKNKKTEQDPPPRAETLSQADAQHKADLIEAVRVWVDAHLPKDAPPRVRRAKVQMESGEILTSEESLARLKQQAEDKKAKQSKAGAKKGKAGAGVAGPSGPTVGAMDNFVKRGSRSSVRQRKPQHPQEEDPDDLESGHEDPPSSQGTNPEDSTVVPDGMDTTAPVDMPGSPHAVAGPSVPPCSPPRTPPMAQRTLRSHGQKRKAAVVESSTEDSDSDTDNDGSATEPEPEATPPSTVGSSMGTVK